MELNYIVTASGISKKNGKPYSRYDKIIELDNETHHISFISDKNAIYTDIISPIGTISKIKQTVIA